MVIQNFEKRPSYLLRFPSIPNEKCTVSDAHSNGHDARNYSQLCRCIVQVPRKRCEHEGLCLDPLSYPRIECESSFCVLRNECYRHGLEADQSNREYDEKEKEGEMEDPTDSMLSFRANK